MTYVLILGFTFGTLSGIACNMANVGLWKANHLMLMCVSGVLAVVFGNAIDRIMK